MITEKISEAMAVEYRDDGLIIYRFTNILRDTVDQWAQHSHAQDLKAAAENRPLARLLDVRKAGYPTPYAIGKALEISRMTPENLQEVLAILTSDRIGTRMFSSVMRHMPSRLQQSTAVFVEDETLAVDWLLNRLAQIRK